MENAFQIKRNPKGMYIQILLSGITALILGLFITWLFEKLLGKTSGGGSLIQVLTWIFLLLMWGGSAARLWFDWNAKRYQISPDALIVHAKAGKLGKAQTLYRYESFVSIRMTQGFLGERYGYGDVRITIPKLENELVLNDIDNPNEQLSELQKRMNERAGQSGTTAALIN